MRSNIFMDYKFVIIILIVLIVILTVVIIAVSAVKSKKKKAQSENKTLAPMPEVSKDTLNLVNDVYDEVKREKEEMLKAISDEAVPPMDDILLNDIDPELLNDIDPEFLMELTSSDTDSSKTQEPPQGHDEITSLVSVEDNEDEKTECKAVPECVKAYLENSYYLKGRSFSEKQIKNTFIAIEGNDVRLSTNIDSREIEVIIKDSNVYLVNPVNKKYMEMSKKLMKMLGRGEEDFDFASVGVSENMRNSACLKFTASVDGVACDCYEFKTDERILRLYVSTGGEFKLMMNYDVSGELVSALKTDEFIPHAGGDYINFDSLKKVGMMAFFSDMV